MYVPDFLALFDQGRPSVDELGRGMHLCFRNACCLIDDAEALLERSPARAITLSVLALEETAKIFLLCNAAALAGIRPVPWKKIKKKSRLFSHQHKQMVFATYGRAIIGKLRESSGNQLYNVTVPSDLVPLLDRFKQLGLYVDCFQGQFDCPQRFGEANIEWADWLIGVAQERLRSIEDMHGSEQSSIRVARKSAKLAKMFLKAKTIEDKERIIREALVRNLENLGNSTPNSSR